MDVSATCPLKEWYSDLTLVQAMDNLKVPLKLLSQPLRAQIISSNATDISDSNSKIFEVSVKVIQGILKVNSSINITMNPCAWVVTKISTNDASSIDCLESGRQGSIRLQRKYVILLCFLNYYIMYIYDICANIYLYIFRCLG
jgi:translation elongation factor EF-1alpha